MEVVLYLITSHDRDCIGAGAWVNGCMCMIGIHDKKPFFSNFNSLKHINELI